VCVVTNQFCIRCRDIKFNYLYVCLGSKDCVQKFGKESISLRASRRRTVKDIIILNGNVTVFRPAVWHFSNGAWVHNSPGVRLP